MIPGLHELLTELFKGEPGIYFTDNFEFEWVKLVDRKVDFHCDHIDTVLTWNDW